MATLVRNIYALTDQPLQWMQSPDGGYELLGHNQRVATLKPGKNGVVAKSANRQWTFTPSGVVNPKVIVKAGSTDLEYAVFTKHWLGRAGKLKIDSSTEYRFECAKFPCQERVWLDFHDRVLIRMIPQSDPGLKVAVLPLAHDNVEMPLLALLGLYLLVF